MLAGIVLFVLLEKFSLWPHCHESDCVAHEVPQEVRDFGILLDSGCDRVRALLLNTLSSAATLPGALLTYFWPDAVQHAVPFILALSAASFVYIAAADPLPSLNRQVAVAASIRRADPRKPWPGRVQRYPTLHEACVNGVDAEIDNAALYERLLEIATWPDILAIFRNLQEASRQRHLRAFRRCAGRRG